MLVMGFTVARPGLVPAHVTHSYSFSITSQPVAFWVWTPETNKWVNPKYSVKGTPQEQLEVGLVFKRLDIDRLYTFG